MGMEGNEDSMFLAFNCVIQKQMLPSKALAAEKAHKWFAVFSGMGAGMISSLSLVITESTEKEFQVC